MCKSLRLNPLTKPIDYLSSPDGKLVPYINSLGVAQLRGQFGISTKVIETRTDKEFIYCTVAARDRTGRVEEAIAVVPLQDKYGKPLTGERKANAIMKSETKAKRRATLALCGLSWADGNTVKADTIDPPLDVLPSEETF